MAGEIWICNSSFRDRLLYIFLRIYVAAWLIPDGCKSIYSPIKCFLASNLYVARRVLTYAIVFTPCEYETFGRTCFFTMYILSFFLRFSHSSAGIASVCHPTWRSSDEARTERGETNRGRGRGIGRDGVERKKEKAHNVYSSPIEDGRSFEGSANVARIWIWKYATN